MEMERVEASLCGWPQAPYKTKRETDANFKKMLYYLTTQAAKKPGMKVITEDVIQFAGALTGKDYHPWFDRYVYGTETPPKNW